MIAATPAGQAMFRLDGQRPGSRAPSRRCDTLRRDHLETYGYSRDTSRPVWELAPEPAAIS